MGVEIVHQASFDSNGLVILTPAPDEEVWLTFYAPWWNLAAWFHWWLQPGEKAWMVVRREVNGEAKKTRVRAVCVSTTIVRQGKSKR